MCSASSIAGGYPPSIRFSSFNLTARFGLSNYCFLPELLLVIWSIFFIASQAESPTHKGRDFAQPIQRGKEFVRRKRRRTSTNAVTPDSEGCDEEQPYWDATRRGGEQARDGSIRAISPVSDFSAGVTVSRAGLVCTSLRLLRGTLRSTHFPSFLQLQYYFWYRNATS